MQCLCDINSCSIRRHSYIYGCLLGHMQLPFISIPIKILLYPLIPAFSPSASLFWLFPVSFASLCSDSQPVERSTRTCFRTIVLQTRTSLCDYDKLKYSHITHLYFLRLKALHVYSTTHGNV